jgi:hypothetical protein
MNVRGEKMSRREEKNVYLFGAGASVAAGLPPQARLLNHIYTIEKPDKITVEDFMNTFDDVFSVLLIKRFPYFEKCRRVLSDFIIKGFGSQSLRSYFYTMFASRNAKFIFNYKENDQDINDKWEKIFLRIRDINVSLEDLFTLLDKALILKEYFGTYSLHELSNIQEKLNYCIVYSISFSMQMAKNNPLYQQISDFFVNIFVVK